MRNTLTLLLICLLGLCTRPAHAQTIAGTLSVCNGSCTTLMGIPAGGTWTSSSPAIATVGVTAGVVCGVSTGIVVLTYTAPSMASTTAVFTVNPLPAAISGASSLPCSGTTTYTDATPGGTWSSSNTSVATVSAAGVVSGITPGTATISYTLATGCYVTKLITITSSGGSALISGATTVCVGSSTTLSPTPAGGVWATPGLHTSVAGNVITGTSAGSDMLTYTLTTACGVLTTTHPMTVSTTPSVAAIGGTTAIWCGSTGTLTCATAGGVWTSSTPGVATVNATTGVVTAVSPGTTTITYSVTSSCGTAFSTAVVTVTSGVWAGTISGPTTVCTGSTITLSSTVSGGTWSTTFGSATVSSGGVVTGVTAGVDTIIYTVTTSCGTATSSYPIIVSTSITVGPITGPSTMCAGDVTTFSCATPGGVWSSTGGVSVVSSTGVGTATAAGTAIITYSLSLGCGTSASTLPVVVSSGVVSASVSGASCGDTYMAVASGATSYSWAPTTGVTCPTCVSTNITPAATTTYTVTGTTGGCTGMATITVNGDRIKGHVIFGSTAPSSPTARVWLIQFNPLDSSITATDSMNTCTDAGVQYYEFDSKPAGNYLVKARLLSATSGTSGYVPTYGNSTTAWFMATNISHSGATDVQDINMIYGTVPAGPGFISGYVYAGAGRGTSGGSPVQGMLIYLKDAATGNVLTFTYTDATGLYMFPALGYGTYVVYPEAFAWNTTPSATITLGAEHPTAMNNNFKQYTNMGIITPYITNGVNILPATNEIVVYPNPASGSININWNNQPVSSVAVTISDILGNTVYTTTLALSSPSGTQAVDVSSLAKGMYIISIKSSATNLTSKLILE